MYGVVRTADGFSEHCIFWEGLSHTIRDKTSTLLVIVNKHMMKLCNAYIYLYVYTCIYILCTCGRKLLVAAFHIYVNLAGFQINNLQSIWVCQARHFGIFTYEITPFRTKEYRSYRNHKCPLRAVRIRRRDYLFWRLQIICGRYRSHGYQNLLYQSLNQTQESGKYVIICSKQRCVIGNENC